jgi:hypothetical protein
MLYLGGHFVQNLRPKIYPEREFYKIDPWPIFRAKIDRTVAKIGHICFTCKWSSRVRDFSCCKQHTLAFTRYVNILGRFQTWVNCATIVVKKAF